MSNLLYLYKQMTQQEALIQTEHDGVDSRFYSVIINKYRRIDHKSKLDGIFVDVTKRHGRHRLEIHKSSSTSVSLLTKHRNLTQ